MRDPAARRMPPGRALASLALLILVFPGSPLPARPADDPPERLTPEQRQELERQAVELLKAGLPSPQRGELGTAVEKTRQSLRLLERLYPKADYPKVTPTWPRPERPGLPAQGPGDYDSGARGYSRAGAGDAGGPDPKDRYPRPPRPGHQPEQPGRLLEAQGDYVSAGYSNGRWRCTRPSTPGTATHRGTPTWP